MANKRNLKHTLNTICEELMAECIAASLYGAEKNHENADALLFCILKTQRHFTARVSHPEPGMMPREYYKDLKKKFAAQVEEVVDQINSL